MDELLPEMTTARVFEHAKEWVQFCEQQFDSPDEYWDPIAFIGNGDQTCQMLPLAGIPGPLIDMLITETCKLTEAKSVVIVENVQHTELSLSATDPSLKEKLEHVRKLAREGAFNMLTESYKVREIVAIIAFDSVGGIFSRAFVERDGVTNPTLGEFEDLPADTAAHTNMFPKLIEYFKPKYLKFDA